MRILPPNTRTSPTDSDGGDSSGQQSPSHHDAVTQQALNALVSSSEQSYGQFLQGFSHLTTADIVPAVIQDTRSGNPRGPARYVDLIRDPEEPPSLKVPVQPLGSSLPSTATTWEAPVVDEILYLNSLQTSNFTNLQEPPPKRVLRLDNFVEDGSNIFMDENAGSGLEIENMCSGYAASFLVTSSERPRPEAECLHQLGSVNDPSCNSSPTTKVHFNNNLKQPTPQAKIGHGDELVYDPGLDLPNPGEVVDADREDPARGQAQATAMVTNVRKMAYSAREADSGKRSQHNYTDIERFVHVHSDNEIDVVTPFTLDDEFDYDNVILTPKFTPEEQAELKEFSQSGNEEMVGKTPSG